jgi:hypothetical protein
MKKSIRSSLLACCAGLLLCACSPKYDWREIRGEGAPYSIMLPAKPASYSRPVNIGGNKVTMTMTATEVDGITFAVGTAELPDAATAASAVTAMKEALVKNIHGTVQREARASSGANADISIDASGKDPSGQARVLHARFLARDKRVYQVIVTGKEGAVPQEAVDTFLASFKPV